MKYTIFKKNGTAFLIRDNDTQANIPFEVDNRDYQLYLVWAEDNTADEHEIVS